MATIIPMKRKHIRLDHWDDTTPGMHFVTFCTYKRCRVLGCIQTSPDDPLLAPYLIPSLAGRACTKIAPACGMKQTCVMPDHVHVLIQVGANGPNTAADAVRHCKRAATLACHEAGMKDPVWQRGFYDHIVHDEANMERIMRYMEGNPIKWAEGKHRLAKEMDVFS